MVSAAASTRAASTNLNGRSDVADPSPQVRPFRLVDAARVLAAADTTGAPGRDLIQSLRQQFDVPAGRPLAPGRARRRPGVQPFRRDVLHPLGPDGVRPYADFTGEATMGPFAS